MTLQRASLAVLFCAISAAVAYADIDNPGFETGVFPSWTTAGATSIVDDADLFPFVMLNPASTYAASLSTDFGDGSPVNAESLETFLGLAAGTLTGAGYTLGSAISQSFNLAAPTAVQYYCVFATEEDTPDAAHNDAAYVVLNGVLTLIADTNSTFPNSLLGYDLTDFFLVDLGVLSAGNHTLSFVVLNHGHTTGESLLLVDTHEGIVPAPEPASAALLALAGVAMLSRRTARSTD